MKQGKILFAEHDGAYILRLQGDVRLNLCTALDSFIADMFASQNFLSIMIDLSEAEGVDSTTLGLLAKLSIESQQQHNFRPVIFSDNDDITRLLESMGFHEVFDIRPQAMGDVCELGELPANTSSEAQVNARVVEAHRILCELNYDNKLKFQELLQVLDNDCGCA